MSGRITRRPQARRDVIQAALYIAEGSVDAAMRFADSVRATEELLAETPGIGAPRDFGRLELSGIRMHSVKDFRKYLIFYIPEDDGIEIVRVLHGGRDILAEFGDAS